MTNWSQATANLRHVEELCERARQLASAGTIVLKAEAVKWDAATVLRVSADAMADEARRLLAAELAHATTSHDCLDIAQRGQALESRFATLVDAAYAKAEAL